MIVGVTDERSLAVRLNELLLIDVFVRAGCPRCASAKLLLARMQSTYVGLSFRVRDIVSDSGARQELDQLVRRYQQAAASVPAFHLCQQLVVGFDHETTTGRRVEEILTRWTYACQPPAESSSSGQSDGVSDARRVGEAKNVVRAGLFSVDDRPDSPGVAPNPAGDGTAPADLPGRTLPTPGPPLPVPGPSLPLPGSDDITRPSHPLTTETTASDTIDVPVFGRLSASRLGLPLFTIAVGLVDGFNPCAMWVLVFLLSILVNLKDRWRILAVAGAFVVISGLAYFAFMAAWLNIFRFVGLLRPVQISLAAIAILIGAIHIKDFFAFKQGVSLSIPEAAKPGIYARVRKIVTAENLLGAPWERACWR